MTNYRMAIAAFAIVAAATTGSGAAGDLTPQYDKCIQADTGNMQYAQCGQDEIDRQDRRLDAAWGKLFKCMSDNATVKTDILDEQRLWIKFKDAACEYDEATDADGTLLFGREAQVLSLPACRATIISQRAKYLEDLAKEQC